MKKNNSDGRGDFAPAFLCLKIFFKNYLTNRKMRAIIQTIKTDDAEITVMMLPQRALLAENG